MIIIMEEPDFSQHPPVNMRTVTDITKLAYNYLAFGRSFYIHHYDIDLSFFEYIDEFMVINLAWEIKLLPPP